MAGGALNINADAALGAAAGAVSFVGNATLQAGTNKLALGGPRGITIGTGVAATIDTQAYLMSIYGLVSGSGSLAKAGPACWCWATTRRIPA